MDKATRDFPPVVSLTITNNCNLRCWMCAQWSDEGYIRNGEHKTSHTGKMASFESILKTVDEIKQFGAFLIIRGGEPLLYPRIVELIEYAKKRGVPLSVETNGVLLKQYAESLVKLKIDDLRISLDGPEQIHDHVRGVKGTFARLRAGLQELAKYEEQYGYVIRRGVTCTLSGDNYLGLGEVPEAARSLGIKNVCIVPYYYFPNHVGQAYERLMREELACEAYSWKGFHHESSGVDVDVFLEKLKEYKSNLGDLNSEPYMEFTDQEYRDWYTRSDTTVHQAECRNLWGLLDIQPDGAVNFCVDFPDYVIGNIEENTLHELWHSDRANKFRELRSGMEMPVCFRCGDKYMGAA